MLKGDSLLVLTALCSQSVNILNKDTLQLLKMDMEGLGAAQAGGGDDAEEDDFNEDYDAGPGEYDDFF
jgi:hypothetical protein